MYHKFFDLREPAFSIAVNPRFLYMSKQHREALIHLLFGVKGGGFVCLTGEVGTGKTTIIQRLIKRLPENTDIAIVLNPMADAADMLYTICDELKVDYQSSLEAANKQSGGRPESLKPVYDALNAFLLKNHRDGRNTVLLIDEAQLLNAEALEQVRLLTNLETTTKKLLQIILVGQPELNSLLAEPRLRQLAQRITARFHLRALNYEETEAYIHHRWTVAGGDLRKLPFVPNAIKTIHQMSEGIPRKINLLCERSLIGAYAHNQVVITPEILKLARKEVLGDPEGLPKKRALISPTNPSSQNNYKNWLIGLAACCGVLFISLLAVLFTTNDKNSSEPSLAIEQKSATETVLNSALASSTRTDKSTAIKTSIPEQADNANIYFQSRGDSFEALTEHSGYGDIAETICDDNLFPTVSCSTGTANSWQELLDYNRPALLTFITADKFLYYATLIGVKNDLGIFINANEPSNENSAPVMIPLRELGGTWSGEYSFIWSRPPGFSGSISQGQASPTISWIAKQFALLDNQSQVLAKDRYNEKLKKRIMLFQQEHGLTPDGIVGEMTLLKLNEVVGQDKTLNWSLQQEG